MSAVGVLTKLAMLAGAGVMTAGVASCGSSTTAGYGPGLFLGGLGIIFAARIVAWLAKPS